MVMRYGFDCFRKHVFRNFFRLILVIMSLSTMIFVFVSIGSYKPTKKVACRNASGNIIATMRKIVIPSNATMSAERNVRCNYYNCFNAYACGKNEENRIQVYVYPIRRYVDENGRPVIEKLSREFYSVLQTVTRSKYYTANPEDACIFLPSFDTLSQDNFQPNEVSRALNSLPYWRNGENHLILNFLPAKHSTVVGLNTGNAIIAGAGFNTWTFRPSFDISLPVFVPVSNLSAERYERVWLVTVSQLNIPAVFEEKVNELVSANSELVVVHRCPDSNVAFRCYQNSRYPYPNVLQKSIFCIVFRGTRLAQPVLLEAMAAGCIPIILSDTLVMPFQEIIDWKRATFSVLEENLPSVVELAKSVSTSRVHEMSAQCLWLYQKYFSSMEAITNTTLDILNQRVFPENALFYEDWNLRQNLVAARSPLFLRTKSHAQGFTAVVLTYDRVDSLFVLIQKLALVPSLSAILVVWNNQRKSPPQSDKWPKISKPVKLIRTNENKLSNRFFPYSEIETEAVLSLDDDISMLTEDELDFGFEVWREFPDRIVGFPSRTHVWDNVTQSWRYESEWTNEISMILTGAAFYHKYWNYLYTKKMPSEIKEWVDSHMNCEDIAMNFLVANVTNKAPIKVAPRKKFKCPECTNTEMLSSDLSHMRERSKCIDKFGQIYGRIPLRKVEFRADPVLYKDSFPAKLKRFKNIGNL